MKRCAERGVPVVVSSRVPEGRLVASYGGGGGGHDLVAAGAVHSSTLRPGQARILLAALLAGKAPRKPSFPLSATAFSLETAAMPASAGIEIPIGFLFYSLCGRLEPLCGSGAFFCSGRDGVPFLSQKE